MYLEKVIRDFRGGLNTQDLPAELDSGGADAPGGFSPPFPVLKNLIVAHRGRLQLRRGQHKITPDLGAVPQGLIRFASTAREWLVVAVNNLVKKGDETALPATMTTIHTGVAAGVDINFTSLYSTLFWADGTNPPQKWTGLTTLSQNVGITAPATPATSADGGAGLLDSSVSGASPYSWYVTFRNSVTGTESNPSPISTPPLALVLKKAHLTAIPVSADAQVDQRRIWRVGGTHTLILLVGTIADNVTTTFDDNSADLALAEIQISFAHDQPPVGIQFFHAHKNRLLGAGDAAHPTRLYVSSLGFPEYFPVIIEDSSVDGTFFDIDEDPRDPIVGLAGTGSIGIIARRRSIYGLFGDDITDMKVRQISQTGIASLRTLVRCKNQVLFLGLDAVVYSISSDEPAPLSLELENVLKAIPISDLKKAAAAYHDQRYVLSIPRPNATAPAVFAYDFRSESWIDLSTESAGATAFYADPGSATSGELLMTTKAGYTWVDGSPFNGVVSLLSEADTTTALPIAFKTFDFEFGKPNWVNRTRALRLIGICHAANPNQPVTVTITASLDGRADVVKTYQITDQASAGVLFHSNVHASLVGQRINIAIQGTVTAFELNTISCYYSEVGPVL